jgi:group I intron endonuclease
MKKFIYKITNLKNNKIYIGQTKDIQRRFREHKNCMYGSEKCKNKHLYRSIQKYGIESFSFEIIEETEHYNEREKYWIDYYNSNDPNCGYNVDFSTLDGNHIGRLSEEQIQEIYWKLANTEISFERLRQEYNLKNEDSIRNINRGIVYYHSNTQYPIRKNRFVSAREKAVKVISDLKNTSKSFQQIAEENNTTTSYVYQINKGIRVFIKNEEYPIRKTKDKKQPVSFSEEDIQAIKKDIRETSLSWKELSEKYGGNIKVYQHINTGKTYYDPQQEYPIRKQKNIKKIPENKINEIINLLQNSSLLQKEIAEKTQISEPTIRKINRGEGIYFRQNLSYPLR